MRIEISRDMWRKITIYSVSACFSILIFTLVNHLPGVMDFLGKGFDIIAPFLFGIAFAFLLNRPSCWMEKWFSMHTNLKVRNCRLFAVMVVFFGALLCVVLIFAFIIPSLVDSLRQFGKNLTVYSNSFSSFVISLSMQLGMTESQANSLLSQIDMFPTLSKAFNEFLPKLADMGYDAVKFLMNTFIALASCFYIMLDKDSLLLSVRKINYSLFSEKAAGYLSVLSKDAQTVFELYIVGNLLDALTVGIITYIGCLVMRLPYAPMFAFLIGTTNIIPVFGPFLGGIPAVVLLFLIKPWYGFLFAVFILILQQIDGNVIKPIILGDRLGISGFWILFSVTVGGALFGVIGMFLGVPVFALVYAAVSDLANMRLQEKHIDLDSKAGQ